MDMDTKTIIEALLFASTEPLSLMHLQALLTEPLGETPDVSSIQAAVSALQQEYQNRGVALVAVGSGYRFQTVAHCAPWVLRLQTEKPSRYSKAVLETLAIVAYRQPVTRADIEAIRGVSVSTPVLKTLLERGWIQASGYRDTPGRPAQYVTTTQFLNDFNMSSLDALPVLPEIADHAAPFQALYALEAPIDASQTDVHASEAGATSIAGVCPATVD